MNDAGKGPSFSDRFERFLEGATTFICRFLATPVMLVFHPASLAEDLLCERKRPAVRAVPPLTFLFACSLLFSVSVSSVYSTQVDWPQLFTHLRQQLGTVSIARAFVLSLPVALTVLLASYALDRITNKKKKKRLRRIAFLSYVPAVEMLGLFLLYLVMAVFNLIVDARIRAAGFPDYTESEQTALKWVLLSSLGLLAVVSLVVSFNVPWFLLKATRPEWSALRRRVWTVALAIAIQMGLISAVSVAILLNKLPSLTDAPLDVTPLTVVEQRIRRIEGGADASFKLYLENAEDHPITIVDRGMHHKGEFIEERGAITDWPQLAWHDFVWTGLRLRVVDSPAGNSPFVEVPPWGRSWLVLEGRLDEDMLGSLQTTASRGGVIRIVVPVARGT
ncbi:MAG: hypothetical protein OER77_17690, partial [Myxococcales bacterium]|nr:hypothetical protein [Myxococcales bacterium]